ncbi:hypothetical protein RhiirA5_363410 [Rhizophagus irregularis]|uniref:Uncharacterized protein n=3 Tax=Rhizophagus irregularis TaxID=588596 RepID=U9U3W9_RHIID|nr:hypothetical protein GLOIN_2v1717299 [Rhizophagus irregularis DAOM 181602=DAOM 197198]EXX71167.1 hypothetical protein RirG_080930 [Rhizophagus irregularis DAOM 197198w]PKC03242.1 hypothetical protein RhiirA5_363410 [Rhizophagus irregularis]PKC65494.1 hypothetical protein RhiirA1_420347 [Rhizophagus irregularis]PKK64649.1 hypothetical protein RhiirC2_756375 [Rhizophagus irregularis]PKY32417.1 hypothetical protein RhiirB3_420129 [Rhizophagus irregularis]|eukprot:XP_025166823.1 hypothetical protein GLOIN_2v1717299 [Rhizophagus irregularis DAOM 181602=DAOM 197198]
MLAEKSLSAPNSPRNSLYKRHRMSLPISRAYVNPYFSSREETGVMLAKLIKYYARNPDTVVLSIKPTATALAHEIAKELELPLDLFLVSSFQFDGMTVGAITDKSDQPLLKEQIIRGCDIPKETINDLIAKERIALETLKKECCPLNLPLPASENATLILCTDGIQSGQNARNAIAILKKILGYRGKIVLVAGIMGSDAQKMFMKETEDAIAVLCPQVVGTVASWYDDTRVLTNEEVRQIMSQARDLSKNI